MTITFRSWEALQDDFIMLICQERVEPRDGRLAAIAPHMSRRKIINSAGARGDRFDSDFRWKTGGSLPQFIYHSRLKSNNRAQLSESASETRGCVTLYRPIVGDIPGFPVLFPASLRTLLSHNFCPPMRESTPEVEIEKLQGLRIRWHRGSL